MKARLQELHRSVSSMLYHFALSHSLSEIWSCLALVFAGDRHCAIGRMQVLVMPDFDSSRVAWGSLGMATQPLNHSGMAS